MSLTDAVDIVIVNCNNGENLKRCVTSIKENTEGKYHLVVVDQNSKDGTPEWLQNNISHVILDNKRLGRADGRNKGLRVCKYNWIILIDVDCIITDKMWLDKMWNYTIDPRIGLIEVGVKTRKQKIFSALSFCMIRKQCLKEVGDFDKHIIKGYELDWLARYEWSWWKTGYCYDLEIRNHKGRGLSGALYQSPKEVRKDALIALGFKYSMNFLEETLVKNIIKRNEKAKELLEGKHGGSIRDSSYA